MAASMPAGPTDIGFVLNASDSILRGLAIEGFSVGVSVPNPTDVGDLIQGNFIGEYLAYPVDPNTGVALPVAQHGRADRAGQHAARRGPGLAERDLGGTDPQDSNVIGGNGAQGVLIEPGASGNQVLGNQIGLVGPSSSGVYFLAGNGAEGVLIESSGTASDPSSIVYASSNIIGGAVGGAGNLISDNHSDGVHIEGVGATRNLVEANYIGAAPGGGYLVRQRPARQPRATACSSTTRPITRSAEPIIERRQRDLVERGQRREHHRARCHGQHGRSTTSSA